MASIVSPALSHPRDALGLLSPTATAKLAAMADVLSVADGGFSVDPLTGTDVTGGYAVSVHPECERIYIGDVTPDDLRAYLTDVAATASLPGRVFGGWRDPDSGAAYLDVSVVVGSRSAALRLARTHGQLAVFDFAVLASIPVTAAAAA